MKGLFIVMEGPDGSGKTTQINLLKEYLEEAGYECLITREPGNSDRRGSKTAYSESRTQRNVSSNRNASLCGIKSAVST